MRGGASTVWVPTIREVLRRILQRVRWRRWPVVMRILLHVVRLIVRGIICAVHSRSYLFANKLPEALNGSRKCRGHLARDCLRVARNHIHSSNHIRRGRRGTQKWHYQLPGHLRVYSRAIRHRHV